MPSDKRPKEYRIYLEGCIGAGKSFLADHLADEIKRRLPNALIFVYHEDPDEFFLSRFNNDPACFETIFQISMMCQRIKNRVKSFEDSLAISSKATGQGEDVVFSIHDTGLISNKAFIMTNFQCSYIDSTIKDLLLSVEENMTKPLAGYLAPPTAVFLLNCSADRSKQNIKKRGRDTEEHIPFDYLKKLGENYSEIFGQLPSSIRKHKVDVSNGFALASDICDKILG
jgi:deoxyadenosine/deoxycytidine kinase